MGADGGAQQVVGVLGIGDPIAKCLVDGSPQGGVAGGDRLDAGTEEPHALHVRSLALDVDGAHVHRAVETHPGTGGGGRHPVLAGPGLGDHTACPHLPGQQRLTNGVVDLVGTGVGQVLTLQPDLATPRLPEPRRRG